MQGSEASRMRPSLSSFRRAVTSVLPMPWASRRGAPSKPWTGGGDGACCGVGRLSPAAILGRSAGAANSSRSALAMGFDAGAAKPIVAGGGVRRSDSACAIGSVAAVAAMRAYRPCDVEDCFGIGLAAALDRRRFWIADGACCDVGSLCRQPLAPAKYAPRSIFCGYGTRWTRELRDACKRPGETPTRLRKCSRRSAKMRRVRAIPAKKPERACFRVHKGFWRATKRMRRITGCSGDTLRVGGRYITARSDDASRIGGRHVAGRSGGAILCHAERPRSQGRFCVLAMLRRRRDSAKRK